MTIRRLAARHLALFCVLALAPLHHPAANAAEGDPPGAKDHPDLGRFDGTVITAYDVKDYDAYTLPLGPIARGGDNEDKELEGRITRIAYKRPPGPSVLEIARNYENRLEEKGYEILFMCETKECGGSSFRYGTEVLPLPKMDVSTSNFRYIAARKKGEQNITHASVIVSVSDGTKELFIQNVIIDSAAMEARMIDAEEMSKALGETGHIALYGIYFDTDKTDTKPGSRPTLNEIAKLLEKNTALEIIVVGHTDMQGSFDYNMDLSKRRAKAVRDDLIQRYGIAADRLEAEGAGYLAPLGSNKTEEGRAKNRRVELIER